MVRVGPDVRIKTSSAHTPPKSKAMKRTNGTCDRAWLLISSVCTGCQRDSGSGTEELWVIKKHEVRRAPPSLLYMCVYKGIKIDASVPRRATLSCSSGGLRWARLFESRLTLIQD